MTNIIVMAVLDGAESLAHDDSSFALFEIFAGLDDVEEFASFTKPRLNSRYYSVTRKQIRSVSQVSWSRTILGWSWV